MPEVIVRFFGPARDVAGRAEERLSLEAGATAGDAAALLAKAYPGIGAMVGARLAVNRRYVAMNERLAEGDEIAVIPLVSGGGPLERVALVTEAIDVAALASDLGRPEAGALAMFAGVVRAEESAHGALVALTYHAYEVMALEEMRRARERALRATGALDAAVHHRLGRLGLGEVSIGVAVSAAHRAEAFEACRMIVNLVKTDVPIWKKNVWEDNSDEWVQPTC